MKRFILLFCIAIILNIIIISPAKAEASFSPSYIISDYDMLNTSAMTLNEIQNFLSSKGGYLANYSCLDTYKKTKKASEIIYNAVNNNYNCDGVDLKSDSEFEKKMKCKIAKTVSPKFLLVMLQKEMSLVEDSTPKQTQLDWALGYGCPDGDSCNKRWEGFGKQVNSAALQFRDYMDNPNHYTYKKNGTYTFTNKYSTTHRGTTIVTPINTATAALYNYTPHVYNGNYNFWKIWNRYWGDAATIKTPYPNGSLLQANGEEGVWYIENDMKRPITSKSVLMSRFNINKIVQVDISVLNLFPNGSEIKFSQYSIIKSPDGKIYLLVDNKKRNFADLKAFKQMGYNPDEIMEASIEDINAYIDGSPITSDSIYPQGALLRDTATGGVFWVEEGTKAPLIDYVFLITKFKDKKLIQTTAEELDGYTTVAPITFDNGELIKIDKGRGIYVLDNNKLRPIRSTAIFDGLGYKLENVISVPIRVFNLYTPGEEMTLNN